MLYHAPQPHVPDVSEVMVTSGGPFGMITAAPIHCEANVFHHIISEQNSAFKWMWWCLCFAILRSAIAQCSKGRITLHACCRVPVRDSSSVQVHVFLDSHVVTKSNSHCNLSAGSLSSPCRVSMMMPRKISTGDGPSRFWGLMGRLDRSIAFPIFLSFLDRCLILVGP